jgi:PAS domain S-box-containing protein
MARPRATRLPKPRFANGGTVAPVMRRILDEVETGVMLLDSEGRITFANRVSEEILGVDQAEVFGRRLLSVVSESEEPSSIRAEGQLFSYERGNTKKLLKVATVPISDSEGNEDGMLANVQDMTRVHAMQEEILKRGRLVYLGELSSSLAHEIRNPLAGIKATAQALNEELSEDDTKREYLDRIIKEIDRLNDLLRAFFSFAKPKSLDFVPSRLAELIQEVRGFLAKEAEQQRITMREHYARDLPILFLDVNQMKQVFMNLFLNAFQAMPQGGELTVEVDRGPAARGWVQAVVTDTGEGIQAKDVEKVFDPFFTTKTKGLGLGLSITQKIVEGHGGSIEVESHPGTGTRFVMKFPVISEHGTET